jgi:hypothetical protein
MNAERDGVGQPVSCQPGKRSSALARSSAVGLVQGGPRAQPRLQPAAALCGQGLRRLSLVRRRIIRMAEASGTERTDDLNELRARIEAIETGAQRDEPAPNHDERASGRTGVSRRSSLRRSALQRKAPLHRSRKAI